LGLHPLLDGDRCHWLAADFDGPTTVLDALAYLKAAVRGRMNLASYDRLFPSQDAVKWAAAAT
jgi:hypothetical protein